MRIIRPSFSFMYLPDGEFILAHLEQAARTCYKSEDKAGPDTARQLLARIVRLGHESVLEHASVTIRIVTAPSIVQWPVLCGRIASSLTRTCSSAPSPTTNISSREIGRASCRERV